MKRNLLLERLRLSFILCDVLFFILISMLGAIPEKDDTTGQFILGLALVFGCAGAIIYWSTEARYDEYKAQQEEEEKQLLIDSIGTKE